MVHWCMTTCIHLYVCVVWGFTTYRKKLSLNEAIIKHPHLLYFYENEIILLQMVLSLNVNSYMNDCSSVCVLQGNTYKINMWLNCPALVILVSFHIFRIYLMETVYMEYTIVPNVVSHFAVQHFRTLQLYFPFLNVSLSPC